HNDEGSITALTDKVHCCAVKFKQKAEIMVREQLKGLRVESGLIGMLVIKRAKMKHKGPQTPGPTGSFPGILMGQSDTDLCMKTSFSILLLGISTDEPFLHPATFFSSSRTSTILWVDT
ncbi:hypothetical protein XELAEV_18008499mg, partial [Xenopus laevis]